MCLALPKNTKSKIAKEDIEVYKIFYTGLKSPFFSFYYEVGKLFTTELKYTDERTTFDHKEYTHACLEYGDNFINCKDAKFIGSGFHCALTKERLQRLPDGLSDAADIWKCTIPKGSEYFEGFGGLLASNQIIVNDWVCETYI